MVATAAEVGRHCTKCGSVRQRVQTFFDGSIIQDGRAWTHDFIDIQLLGDMLCPYPIGWLNIGPEDVLHT